MQQRNGAGRRPETGIKVRVGRILSSVVVESECECKICKDTRTSVRRALFLASAGQCPIRIGLTSLSGRMAITPAIVGAHTR